MIILIYYLFSQNHVIILLHIHRYRYSILANLLLVMMCTGGTCCTRWLLMPWLIIYFINFFCFVSISIILFIYPVPLVAEHAPEFPALRTIGLVPLTVAFILGYFWCVILSLFHKMSSENAEKLKHGGSGSLGGPLLGGMHELIFDS